MRWLALLAVVGCTKTRAPDAPPPPTPELVADAAPASTSLARVQQGPCVITIDALVGGDVFRGPPMKDLQPGQKDYSHGVKYLQCRYRVTVAGAAYTLEHDSHHGTFLHDDLDPAICGTPAQAAAAADFLSAATSWCTRERPDLLVP
jgi:hypothetical protein